MVKVSLTDRYIKTRKPAAPGAREDHFDVIVPGLALRVTSTGHKSFVLMARFPARPKNTTRRLLGEYGALTLDAARDKARDWLELVGKGIDPKIDEERRKSDERRKAVNTFEGIARAYLDRHQSLAKHGEATRILEAEFIAKWGTRPAGDITTEEVADAIRAIVKRGAPYQAHNALGHLRRAYNWAVASHEFGLAASPVSVLRPKDLIGARKPRVRTLTDEELRAIWKVCADGPLPKDGKRVRAAPDATVMGYPYGPVVRLLVLTGQRENEVAGMAWDELDLDQKLWTIPARRMKSARTHEVPLAPDALALLASLPRFGGRHVFTTTAGAKPLNGFSKAKARLDKLSHVKDWVIHDLRRTVRTHLSALPVQDMVRELVIAHAQPALHQVYDQHLYRDEKRECLALWEVRLKGILARKDGKPVTETPSASS
jgi:integrase